MGPNFLARRGSRAAVERAQPGARRRNITVTILTLGVAAVLGAATPSWAFEVEVTAPAPESTGVLVSRFHIVDLFSPDSDPVGEGLPATLTLIVDLWRVRSGWWDSLMRSSVQRYRFRTDLLTDGYRVQNPDRTVVIVEDFAALRAHLGRTHEVSLALPDAFPEGARFYLSVKALLEPIRVEDLEEVDAWLSGDVTEGRGGGGLFGIPKAVAGLIVDVSGLGDRNAVGRSPVFQPNPKP